jgi:hypothetical protein
MRLGIVLTAKNRHIIIAHISEETSGNSACFGGFGQADGWGTNTKRSTGEGASRFANSLYMLKAVR